MSDVSATIKSIQDIMRKDVGVDGDAQRIGQLVWMFFLKILDDQEEQLELTEDNYISPIPENLRWRNWAADAEGITGEELSEFINNKLFPALKELNAEGRNGGRALVVRNVFEDAYNYMKSGQLIRQVVNKINEINFNRSADKHTFGDIYEQILKDLQSAGNAGEFYTPRAVTQFMVDMINPQLGEIVIDPACGTGGFLSCAIEHLRHQTNTPEDWKILQQTINGVEKKSLPHLLCTTNMLLHGIEVPSNIKHDNMLSTPIKDHPWRKKLDVILTNPPFGGTEEDGIENNFPATYRTKETADLFLYLIVEMLKDKGRAAVVLPDGTLFGEGIKTRLKEKLLEECNLHTIVRLPNGVFNPYTGIKTNLLFFEKGKPTEEIWYYEHQYPEGYKSYSKTKPIKIEEFDVEKEWWVNRVENDFAWKVDIQTIKDNNYNLDINNPKNTDPSHRDPLELFAEYQEATNQMRKTQEQLKLLLTQALSEPQESEVA
ncbi:MAG TPA: class I SAM-dependent DNA methyltransferase [Alphaproteobacteria bacterium]|nr:class I SAM-dependent DNA methyltransferase [Alphaproteobacteria bacterium]